MTWWEIVSWPSSHFCYKKMPTLNKIRLLMMVQQYLMDSFSWTGKSPLLNTMLPVLIHITLQWKLSVLSTMPILKITIRNRSRSTWNCQFAVMQNVTIKISKWSKLGTLKMAHMCSRYCNLTCFATLYKVSLSIINLEIYTFLSCNNQQGSI